MKQGAEPQWREAMEFAEDVWETGRIVAALRSLLENLMGAGRAEQMEVRKMTLDLRHTDREESERSVTIAEPSAVEADFYGLLPRLLKQAWERRVRLRAIWLKASRAPCAECATEPVCCVADAAEARERRAAGDGDGQAEEDLWNAGGEAWFFSSLGCYRDQGGLVVDL